MVSEMSSTDGDTTASLQRTFKYLLGFSIITSVNLSSFLILLVISCLCVTLCILQLRSFCRGESRSYSIHGLLDTYLRKITR